MKYPSFTRSTDCRESLEVSEFLKGRGAWDPSSKAKQHGPSFVFNDAGDSCRALYTRIGRWFLSVFFRDVEFEVHHRVKDPEGMRFVATRKDGSFESIMRIIPQRLTIETCIRACSINDPVVVRPIDNMWTYYTIEPRSLIAKDELKLLMNFLLTGTDRNGDPTESVSIKLPRCFKTIERNLVEYLADNFCRRREYELMMSSTGEWSDMTMVFYVIGPEKNRICKLCVDGEVGKIFAVVFHGSSQQGWKNLWIRENSCKIFGKWDEELVGRRRIKSLPDWIEHAKTLGRLLHKDTRDVVKNHMPAENVLVMNEGQAWLDLSDVGLDNWNGIQQGMGKRSCTFQIHFEGEKPDARLSSMLLAKAIVLKSWNRGQGCFVEGYEEYPLEFVACFVSGGTRPEYVDILFRIDPTNNQCHYKLKYCHNDVHSASRLFGKHYTVSLIEAMGTRIYASFMDDEEKRNKRMRIMTTAAADNNRNGMCMRCSLPVLDDPII
jgi:hypothetical protein